MSDTLTDAVNRYAKTRRQAARLAHPSTPAAIRQAAAKADRFNAAAYITATSQPADPYLDLEYDPETDEWFAPVRPPAVTWIKVQRAYVPFMPTTEHEYVAFA